MRRNRFLSASDPLDIAVHRYLKSARRAVEGALDACMRARKQGRPRYQTRKMYKDLMELRAALAHVRSTVPEPLSDPSAYPEELHSQVEVIQERVRAANRALHEARLQFRLVDEAFASVEAVFADRESAQVLRAQKDLEVVSAALSRVRGVSGGGLSVDEPSIAPEVQEVVQESLSVADLNEGSDV